MLKATHRRKLILASEQLVECCKPPFYSYVQHLLKAMEGGNEVAALQAVVQLIRIEEAAHKFKAILK